MVDGGGTATSIKAYYGRITGVLASSRGNVLVFKDGRSVKLARNVEVMLAEGKLGSLRQLKPGSLLVCRMNPFTNEAWTVVSTTVSAAKVTQSAKARPKQFMHGGDPDGAPCLLKRPVPWR